MSVKKHTKVNIEIPINIGFFSIKQGLKNF